MSKNRRSFLQQGALLGSGLMLSPWLLNACKSGDAGTAGKKMETKSPMTSTGEMFFKISLAQWSLHKALFSGKIKNMDFPELTRNEFGIEGVEFVNQFFKDKAKDKEYLGQMKKRAAESGVKSLLIMIDGEGGLGDPKESERKKAIENHYKWVEAAKFLGCHSIRVNAFGVGTSDEVAKAAVDGLSGVATFAKDFDINVIVENHGSYSSNGKWLSDVMKNVGMPNCGTLPDFGNFCIKRTEAKEWKDRKCIEEYDRYQGVTELMDYAKAVSAKANEFDADGNDTQTDYLKMMKIVKDAGYKGYVGIEYEGASDDEEAGIMATKKLLEKVRKELS